MNKRWIINLILVGAIALMALVLTMRPGKQAEETYALTTLNSDDIDRITLLRPTRDKLVLDKLNNRWHMTAPVNARSNRFNVSDLLKLAGTESSIRFAANDKALAQYGLDKPAASNKVRPIIEKKVETGENSPRDSLKSSCQRLSSPFDGMTIWYR